MIQGSSSDFWKLANRHRIVKKMRSQRQYRIYWRGVCEKDGGNPRWERQVCDQGVTNATMETTMDPECDDSRKGNRTMFILASCHHGRPFALLDFPNRFFGAKPPFIFFTEKSRRSEVLNASPLLENFFFPPNPYFSFFFCRFAFGPDLESGFAAVRAGLDSFSSSMSNRSGSFSAVGSALDRSAIGEHASR
jgi:hypothetical protein